MAKAKKEETIAEETIVEETINTEEISVDIATGKDQTVSEYARQTPFGIEVWDPETKTTTMKSNG